MPFSPNVTLSTTDVTTLLQRAAAATKSEDGIIAIVDRQGRILGVQVEGGVNSKMNPNSPDFDPNLFVFAVDGAVALARTGGMFGNNQAPLTSRTIGYISQTTVTEREVNSYPSDTNENSIVRGPGYVAAVGIGSHFPPQPSTNGGPNGIAFTPQVDLLVSNKPTVMEPIIQALIASRELQMMFLFPIALISIQLTFLQIF